MKNSKFLLYTVALIALVFFILFRFGSFYFVDYLWYESQSQARLWWQLLGMRLGFYFGGVFLALLFYASNFGLAFFRLRNFSPSPVKAVYYLIGVGVAFVLLTMNGPMLYRLWDSYVLFSQAPDYGLKDPIYEIDASFYMFRLEWYQGLLAWTKLALILCILLCIASYFSPLYGLSIQTRPHHLQKLLSLALPHLAVLGGLLVLVFSINSYLGRYSLIFAGSSEKVAGASYVDVNARAYAHLIFAYTGVLFALVIAVSGFVRRWKAPLALFGAWILVYFFVLQIYPGIVRLLYVNPNEFEAEKNYIEHSIAYTLEGYGLGEIERKKFPANERLSLSTINNNREIVDNIRLWDYRPMRATLRQLQEIRQYYEFLDVDIDRYQINGKMRQVMIAARELNKRSLPTRARTWESRHLQYTHGYGLAMAPSNKVTREGLPELWIRDFPPLITQAGLPSVTRPEIYYGELTNDYILVNTSLKEIDYPLDQNFAETVYQGKGGIALGGGLRYLLLAWEFDTWKFLISHYIHSKSRLLFRRNIHQAVRLLAPFLKYDADPYIVLGKDGKLYWIMDAYTSSARFPYSAPFRNNFLKTALGSKHGEYLRSLRGINYIRNSVKVVIDAYSGDVNFYLMDEKDPIGKAWSNFFPELIKPLSKMPKFLLSHLRYAENLFLVQASIYTDYHMSDARAFYNLEDRWQIANEVYSGQTQQIEPYYTVIKLPGKKKEEYILMLPFIPNNKDNMVAWMAARCDYRAPPKGASANRNDNPYGKVVLFDFPRTRQIYGPIQIESRIDQDPDISKDLTLWNQQGSRVIRGNLLVIPIGNTLLYVEPIYLQSTNSPFPELRRVIVADNKGLVMGESLRDALLQLATESRGETGRGSSMADAGTAAGLSPRDFARQARSLLLKAQGAAARGKWNEFGQKMAELKQTLDRIGK